MIHLSNLHSSSLGLSLPIDLKTIKRKDKESILNFGCNPILLKSRDRLGAQICLLIRYSCIIRLFTKYRQVPSPPRESVFGSRGSPLTALYSPLSAPALRLDYSNILNTKHLHRAITHSWPELKLCTPLFLAPPPRLSAERFELEAK